MKKALIDKWSDYHFKFNLSKDLRNHFLISNIDSLHPKPLYICLLITLSIVSFFDHQVLKILIPLLGVYTYHHLATKSLERSIKITRSYPKSSQEERVELLSYSLANPYNYTFNNINFVDSFDGQISSTNETQLFHYLESLPPHRNVQVKTRLKLNNAMGEKAFGVLSILLTDSIGLNRLKFINTNKQTMLVYPLIHPSKCPPVQPSPSSLHFGGFDTYTRGNNVNFFGTREYQPGDSIKRINWKLSLKSNQTIINEFESNTNSQISIILLNDERLHTGIGRSSTFEYCKDLALSLCTEHIKSLNQLNFIAYDTYLPFKSSQAHLNTMEISMASLKLKSFPTSEMYHRGCNKLNEIEQLKSKILQLIENDTSLYIFTGLIPGKVWKEYASLIKDLARKSPMIHLIAVIGFKELLLQTDNSQHTWIHQLKSLLPEEISELKNISTVYGLKVSIISVSNKEKYSKVIKDAFKTV